MSYGGRLILINSVLTSMPMFLLSFFEVPVGVRKRLDFYRSRFFWQSDENKSKYRLARWDILCRTKDQGGMGIENLEVKNICMLSKWLYMISIEEGCGYSYCETSICTLKCFLRSWHTRMILLFSLVENGALVPVGKAF